MSSNNCSLICAIRAPLILIAIGVLFVLQQSTPYSFWRTWPVLLILIGVLKLLERIPGRPTSGDQRTPGSPS
jgi:LiaI-LiaF-like transmembrane region